VKETFLKIQYLVCWAGCQVMLENRLFDKWDEALLYYNEHLNELSLRIEEITTTRKFKIVWPQNTRRTE
jgi:hypothetical protein